MMNPNPAVDDIQRVAATSRRRLFGKTQRRDASATLVSPPHFAGKRLPSDLLIPRNCHESMLEYRLQAALGADRLKPELRRSERVIGLPRSIW